jgi:hypothetical protein
VRIGKPEHGKCGCDSKDGGYMDGGYKDGGHMDTCGCENKDGGYKDGGYKDGGYKDTCGCENKDGGYEADGSGDEGDVTQSNTSAALSAAGNLALTDQRAAQSQGSSQCGCGSMKPSYGGSSKPSYGSSHESPSCGCASDRVQAVGQFAKTGQRADSSATSEQFWPSNTVSPVRIGSSGSDGDVDQSNASLAKSLAFNAAFTRQEVAQLQ